MQSGGRFLVYNNDIENAKSKEFTIDLSVFFKILQKNILPILVVTVLCAGIGFGYTKLFMDNRYKANARIIVNNKVSDSNSINTSEITAAQQLAEVYSIIIKSDTILETVIENLGLSSTYDSLKNAITVSSVNSTQIIEISMTSTNPSYAKKIIAEIIKVAPDVIRDTIDAGSVKIVSEAKVANNGNPIGPSATTNALSSAVVGLVAILIIVFFKELMNKKFKSEDDVTNTLNLPLIGVIPVVEGKEFSK